MLKLSLTQVYIQGCEGKKEYELEIIKDDDGFLYIYFDSIESDELDAIYFYKGLDRVMYASNDEFVKAFVEIWTHKVEDSA